MSSYQELTAFCPDDTPVMSPAAFKAKYQFIMKLGSALHAFGIQAFRLEAHLIKVSGSLGLDGSFLMTPTSLTFVFASPDKQNEHTHVLRVQPGGIDLGKLANVNKVVEDLLEERITVVQAHIRLNEIEASKGYYNSVVSLLAYGVSSGAFAMLIGTDWLNIFWSTFLGIVCFGFVYWSQFSKRMPEVLEPLVAMVNGFIAVGIYSLEPGLNVPLAVLSSIIIFIPGLSITLGLSELAAKELMSGTARVMNAIMLLFKLYFGAMLGVAIGSLIWGPTPLPETAAMPWWAVWLGVFLLSLTLGAVFNVRKQDIGWGVLSGLLAYVATKAGINILGDALGYFIGAFAVGIYGNLYAIWRKAPATIVLLQGIVVLVPGSRTYMGLDSLIGGHTVAGMTNLGSNTFLIFMSLVAGLIFANIVISPRQSL
ncbi:threonine/serine exporter family protein [Endozoicomonas sp. Mp262]|uniref:threonine/serine ThrE exporter family protein n=1 Tax=Endozoicomonas sp. Mp262 TaxID=2919499 RepID=UPI0021DAA52A